MNRTLLWVAGAATLLLAVAAGVLYFARRPALRGAVINPPMVAADIRLTDFTGKPFDLAALRGKVVVLFFGYTSCPDECPLTMARLKTAAEILGDTASEVRVVMISTDPARDTPDAMKAFLAKFSPHFVGLVGTPDQLRQVWRDYGVAVASGGEVHSSYIYVLDSAGRLRETFLPDALLADLAADLSLLIAE